MSRKQFLDAVQRDGVANARLYAAMFRIAPAQLELWLSTN